MMGATVTPETMKPDSKIKQQHVPEDINLYVTVQVITAMTMKITVFWDMTRVVCLTFTKVSEELDVSIFMFHEFKKRGHQGTPKRR
jgi:hypothetical protein